MPALLALRIEPVGVVHEESDAPMRKELQEGLGVFGHTEMRRLYQVAHYFTIKVLRIGGRAVG